VTLSDEAAIERGCYFSDEAADHICRFFSEFLQIPSGKMASQPFDLLGWQRDFLRNLNGWRMPDGTRRFRRALLAIPKKNGKTVLNSGLALYYGLADGEPQPEVVIAATSRDQASICFDSARNMVRSSKQLAKFTRIVDSRKRIMLPEDGGYIKVISSDARRSEGYNCNLVIYDELHAAPNRDLYDALEYSGIARKQPLLIVCSTAGSDRDHFFRDIWDYNQSILDGKTVDIHCLPVIYSAEGRDVEDPETWREVNPSIPEVLSMDEFASSHAAAKSTPAKWSSFLRYRLNVWSDGAGQWLATEDIDACNWDEDIPSGATCYGGLDLSSTTDLTAFVLYFPAHKTFRSFAWTTHKMANNKASPKYDIYQKLVTEGSLQVMDRPAIDPERIYQSIAELAEKYDIAGIAFDPYMSTGIVNKLRDDGLDMASFRQGFLTMSGPAKEFERRILQHDINLAHNGALNWCVKNCVVEEDAAGNIKPSKGKSSDRIDCAIAAIMAMALAEVSNDAPSVYEGRGVLEF
jgi:phage terminase large subunit-like protein